MMTDRTWHENRTAQPTAKRRVDLDGPDYYPTPAWATHALLAVEQFTGPIWEPACGDGAMAEVLKTTGNAVIATDLYDRGYGESGIDFLQGDERDCVENIITNPPFHSAEGFVHAAIRQSTRKVALLLRLAFLESAARQRTIFNVTPPARVWVFSERITFYPAGAEVKGSGTTPYAWFIFDHSHDGPTELRWLPLGMKAKYGGKR